VSTHVEDSLSAYLDGELAAAERQAVEAHLRGCDECARLLADFAAVDALCRELPLEAPAGYFEALPARIRFKLTPRRRAAPHRRTGCDEEALRLVVMATASCISSA
jgi:anti-sigma factor RsiW